MEIQVYPYPSAHPSTPVQLIQPYSSTAYLHVVPSYHSSLSRYQRTTHRSPPPSGYGYTAHPCLRTSTSTTTGRWEMGDGKWECGNGEFGCLLGREESGGGGVDGERRWGGETRRWFLMQWWKGGCWKGEECVCVLHCVSGGESVCVCSLMVVLVVVVVVVAILVVALVDYPQLKRVQQPPPPPAGWTCPLRPSSPGPHTRPPHQPWRPPSCPALLLTRSWRWGDGWCGL